MKDLEADVGKQRCAGCTEPQCKACLLKGHAKKFLPLKRITIIYNNNVKKPGNRTPTTFRQIG